MGDTILHLVSTVAVVVTAGLAGIALLLGADLRRELDRRDGPSAGRMSVSRRRVTTGLRVAGFALTAVFVTLVVVRFTVRG